MELDLKAESTVEEILDRCDACLRKARAALVACAEILERSFS